jgi:hypothetical protein
VRETVEAVRECLAAGGSGKTAEGAPAVSLTALARDLKLDKNSVHHRVKKATAPGYLANLETRRGKPAQIVLADPLPEEGEILPLPAALECWSDFRGDSQEGVYLASGGNGHLVINQGVTEGAQEGIPPSDIHPPENGSNTPTAASTPSNGDGAAWGPFSRYPRDDVEPVCDRCGVPGSDVHGQLIRAHGGLFHPRCATEERAKGPWRGRTREVPPDRRPALGPPGDSLDDLK